MLPQRKKDSFQQFTEFERRIITGLRERGFIFLSRNSSSCAAEQFHTEASLEPTRTEQLEKVAMDD